MSLPSRARRFALAVLLVVAGGAHAATPASAAGVHALADIPLSCEGSPDGSISLEAEGLLPVEVPNGGTVPLDGFRWSVTRVQMSSQPAGFVATAGSVVLRAGGAAIAGPAAVAGRGVLERASVPAAYGYYGPGLTPVGAPATVAIQGAPGTSVPVTLDSIELDLTPYASDPSDVQAPSKLAHCVPGPGADAVLGRVRVATAVPSITVGTSVQLTCGLTLEVTGGLPGTLAPGDPVPVDDLSVFVSTDTIDDSTSTNAILVSAGGLTYSATGTTAPTTGIAPGPDDASYGLTLFTLVAPNGPAYPTRRLDLPKAIPPFVTANGAGPVQLSLAGARFARIETLVGAPVPAPPATDCPPVSRQDTSLATIPVAAPVPTLPSVAGAAGYAWANLGGLLRVHGARLNGAASVQIGTKRVRPLLVVGSKDVWVLAPALPKGTYPLSVRTPAGVSNTATVTYH